MASHSTGDGGIPKRGVDKDGLKRVMSLGGAYGTRNYTVKDLRDCKGKRVLVETLPFSPEEAMAAEEAGIDTMKVPVESDLDFGEELNYKIRAYNCTAIGNENSYSIEQFVPDALPGMDMIIRMRKRYMSLAEYPLEKFYAEDI